MINKTTIQHTTAPFFKKGSLLSPEGSRSFGQKNSEYSKSYTLSINSLTKPSLTAESKVLKTVFDQLNASKEDVNKQKRAAARQKIDRLKEQIKTLRMFASSNAKATIRQAARLARELAAAVKEYLKAGGDPTSVSTVASGTAPAASTDEAVASEQQETISSAQTGVETKAIETTGSSETITKDILIGASNEHEDENKNNSQTAAQQNHDRKLLNASQRAARREEDQKFKDDAKSLLDNLKSILEIARKKIKQEAKNHNNQDVAQAEKALQEAEKLLQNITGSADTLAPFVNILI